MTITGHMYDESASEQACVVCWTIEQEVVPAAHKIEEVTPTRDWNGVPVSRHGFSTYVCCDCFGLIMGITAANWCKNG